MLAVLRSACALVLVLPMMVAACADTEVQAEPVAVAGLAQPDRDAIATAPETASVAGVELSLEASAWRNGMPGSEDTGLILSTTVIAKGGVWPSQVQLRKAFVVLGDQVWNASFTDESRPESKDRVERVARRGPSWATPSLVDIIVEIDDGEGHTLHLAKRAQRIENPV